MSTRFRYGMVSRLLVKSKLINYCYICIRVGVSLMCFKINIGKEIKYYFI